MTTYTLCDSNGVPKAQLSATVACGIFERPGQWKNANNERGKSSQFTVDVDTAYDIIQGGETITLYIWKGDKIILD